MNDVTLLVATGDFGLTSFVKSVFMTKDYSVISATSGLNSINLFKNETPSAVILDIGISDCDALSVMREITRVSDIPVICVSKKEDVLDKVLYLEMGADDFIVMPCDAREFQGRLRTVMRRYLKGRNMLAKELVYRNLCINLSNYTVKAKGENIKLPPKELELLYFLASNPNTVFSRDQLLDKIWGYDYFGDSRTVDVHVKRIREKLENFYDGWSIKTVWGVGYEFSTE
ncbi:MAG: response regulator transcription factor [Clostridia bacterium]|nr:response regulator transcription factor [Clostridia bacterium]